MAASLPTRPGSLTIPGPFPMEGGCACKTVRYRLMERPLVVHCCHCTFPNPAIPITILIHSSLPCSSCHIPPDFVHLGASWSLIRYLIDCQRETGSAFAVNAATESEHVALASATPPFAVLTPSNSGKGQTIFRCPECYVAVWSTYAGSGPCLRFVRVGTLDFSLEGDEAGWLRPDIHIFTSTKTKWTDLSKETVPVVTEYYDRKAIWREESLVRWKNIQPAIKAWKEGQRQVDEKIGEKEKQKGVKL